MKTEIWNNIFGQNIELENYWTYSVRLVQENVRVTRQFILLHANMILRNS